MLLLPQRLKNKTSQLVKNIETTFISSGFKNWKKARERFTLHAGSECHKTAITTLIYESRPIDVQLSNVRASQQEEARKCLLQFFPIAKTQKVNAQIKASKPYRLHACLTHRHQMNKHIVGIALQTIVQHTVQNTTHRVLYVTHVGK